MSEQEIKDGNILIANFMGFPATREELTLSGKRKFKIVDRKLEYHTSWNWLMDVVEKIEGYDDHRVTIFRRCCDIEEVYSTEDSIVEITAQETKIEATWMAIVKFIKWHNEK